MFSSICLTEYSRGAGCGCKLSLAALKEILNHEAQVLDDVGLIVGHRHHDDAAVMDVGQGKGVISTTDFFMPIVDDPYAYGQVAAVNALSDVYAMGGKPLMAIAILAWPIESLGTETAKNTLEGARAICHEAGIPLAGGHSIEASEPIFGLSVTGHVSLSQVKCNNTAQVGDRLFITKPLGIGLLATLQKKKKLLPEHQASLLEVMIRLNRVGAAFAELPGVHAMTDVTGFGFFGHLLEMCEGSHTKARIIESCVPILDAVEHYRLSDGVSGGTAKNYRSYGHYIPVLSERQRALFCDPQTSGGLLVAVEPKEEDVFLMVAKKFGLDLQCIGEMHPSMGESIKIDIESC